jgi:hypothetical protein
MPGKKQDNRRVYPDATRQPRHLDALRKSEAKARQEAYDKLTLEEKIARLPPEPHAKKQRARLQVALEKRNAPKTKPQENQTTPTETGTEQKQTNKQKKYMKGAK